MPAVLLKATSKRERDKTPGGVEAREARGRIDSFTT